MKSITYTIAAVLCATALSARAELAIGTRDIAFLAPERGLEVTATLWYPAEPGGESALVGDNGVFVGAEAFRDAPVSAGPFPVILLAHGGFRAAPNVDSWIASRLAGDGFIVAAVHPPSRGLRAEDAPAEFWLRPADLSAMLTALETDPVFASSLDKDRVGALGVLLGGTSALALAGARVDPAELAATCEREIDNVDCAWFARSGVDLGAIDAEAVGRRGRDARIGSVVAIAPEFVAALNPGSLTEISIPVEVVSMGPDALAAGSWGPSTNVSEIADASPFDAFNDCKDGALSILRDEEGDESLCRETTRARRSIHRELEALIVATFDRSLRVDD